MRALQQALLIAAWFLCIAVLGVGAAAPASESTALRFVDAAEFEGRSLMQFRTIELRDTPARPLVGALQPDPGTRYGLLPVGPRPETALAIVWRPQASGGPELWVDANGDGRFSPDERRRMAGRELAVVASITVQVEPRPRRVQRTLLFRRSALDDGLCYAVRGYAQGSLPLGKTSSRMLLVDGNADGCFDTVGQDRVWIDLDGDGRFDPLTEQFPLGKPIAHGGETWVIRSDALASAVRATRRSDAQGRLRLTIAGRPSAAMKASVELISDLGELVAIDKLGEPVSVPVGEYRVSWLRLETADAAGQPWTYSFHCDKPKPAGVQAGRETAVALLGKIALEVSWNADRPGASPKPGQTLVISPRVTADESFYLSRCVIGQDTQSRSAEGSAEIVLRAPDGKVLSRGISGFS